MPLQEKCQRYANKWKQMFSHPCMCKQQWRCKRDVTGMSTSESTCFPILGCIATSCIAWRCQSYSIKWQQLFCNPSLHSNKLHCVSDVRVIPSNYSKCFAILGLVATNAILGEMSESSIQKKNNLSTILGCTAANYIMWLMPDSCIQVISIVLPSMGV